MRKITKKELKKILSAHKEWLDTDGEMGKKVDLLNADLSKADLYDADLSRAELIGAELSGADLREASLHEAELRGANLCGANLHGTNLCKANLCWANFIGAKLSGACLFWAKAIKADLNNANLKDSDLTSVDFEDASLEGADISGANIYHLKTHGWKIKGIKCTHVYNYSDVASKEDREKSKTDFEKGEFENKYKAMPTIALVLSGFQPIDQYKMGHIIDKANGEFDAGLEINSMKKVFKGIEATLEAESDKDLEEITQMIVREYKNRDLDSKLLAIIRDGKLLGASTNNPDINSPDINASDFFNHLLGANVNNLNIGTVNINTFTGEVTGSTLALGSNSTATTFITNYTNNKEEIDKVLKEFKEVATGEMRILAETLTEALGKKDEKNASGTWKDIIIKASDKAIQYSPKVLKLFEAMKDSF